MATEKMTPRPERGLRAKLARSTTALLALTGLVTLLTLGAVEFLLASRNNQTLEASIHQSLTARGESLVTGHAIVFRSFIQDTAITDMRSTIADAVEMDDVVYGLFTDETGRPWVYCSPQTPCHEKDPASLPEMDSGLLSRELGMDAHMAIRPPTTRRSLTAFGHEVTEFSHPISVDGSYSGTLRYGISTLPLTRALVAAHQVQRGLLTSSLLTITLVVCATLLFSILFVRRTARRITEPLAELTAASARFAAGDHSTSVSISSGDELESLGSAFNQMVNELSTSYQSLEERNLALKQEIQGRKLAQAERTELQEHLIQSQKMEAFGQLAGGVAHDFNNILAVVVGNTELVSELLDHQEYAELRELNQELAEAGQRGINLTRQLLAFARREADIPQVVDPNEAIIRFEKMIRRLLEANVELITTTTSPLPKVLIDPGRLEQVLMNLCVNARDAMPHGGQIQLSTSPLTVADAQQFTTGTIDVGRYVALTVRDQGSGITPELVARIFEPFFTTKSSGHGTGLGLAMVHRIVRDAGGVIDVQSRPGEGSTFRIILPSHAPEEEDVQKTTAPAPVLGHGEKILLCEDDRSVRAMTARMLKHGGYEATVTSTGHEALSKLRKEKFSLLITDAIMPQMDGGQLAQRARELAPDMPTLFLSGYTGGVLAASGIREDGPTLLRKPFTTRELLERVSSLLGQEPPADASRS